MAERVEILISGYGGQGVVRIGQILGQAAVNQGLYTTMLISHGTETRGGYVRSQVVISDGFIASPVVERPDFFLAFSREAHDKFKGLCGAQSVILHNPETFVADAAVPARYLPLPAEALAQDELGSPVYANVILLGALSGQLPLVSEASLLRGLEERLDARFHEANRRAFSLGRNFRI
ncbi:2-oxoacid:acceptor oxidoreductase family protein [Geomesophilobacter sediminis]|uniref:2-oxoacid:acceptor oxidoreductase family protein n=1 Tax=Geomesophilobacter sediminis TaxID=2798584 RepID=A0A8J7LY54_9BACT|nr:2-oxoacid:acceptor oxidoreductase family protein [Geomesophilobacter sediminis]MBJ6724366.1 2-oxoacid:acceptor oxidoreductase family protein [Geomesophilobacter sediminis]